MAVCLELLGEQVELVLDEVTYPATRELPAARSAAEARDDDVDDESGEDDADAGDDSSVHAAAAAAPKLRFGVTLDKIDALNRLLELISAHGDVVSAGEVADYATQTMPVVGHAIFDHAAEVQKILLQVEHQRIDGVAPLSNRVREAPATACCRCMAPRGACSRLSAFGRTDVAGTRADRHGVCPLSSTERLVQRGAETGRAGVAAAELVLPADAV